MKGNMEIISTPITKTVGIGGDFQTLKDALDWTFGYVINSPLTIKILGHNDVDNETGCNALMGYSYAHPNARNVFITGVPLIGAFPANSELPSTVLASDALAKSRFGASIYLPGGGISGTFGVAFPFGLGGLNNLFIKSAARYSVDVGFNGSHSRKTTADICLGNVCISGGVWGVIATKGHVSQSGKVLIMNQIDGGPIDMMGTQWDAQQYDLTIYTAEVPQKYGVHMEAGASLWADNHFIARGKFGHTLKVKESVARIAGAKFYDGWQAVTAEPMSRVRMMGSLIQNYDARNITVASAQEAWGNNSGSNNVVMAGTNATVDIDGVTFKNCAGTNGICCYAGDVKGYYSTVFDACRWSTAVLYVHSATQVAMSPKVINQVAGSRDIIYALADSRVRYFAANSSVGQQVASGSTVSAQ